VRRRNLESVGAAVGAGERRARQKNHAGAGSIAEQRRDQILGGDDARFGRPERGERRHRGLASLDERAIDDRETVDAVRVAARLQRLELVALRGVVRDDELAALSVRDAMLAAELVEATAAVDRDPRLERSRRIVTAGVDD